MLDNINNLQNFQISNNIGGLSLNVLPSPTPFYTTANNWVFTNNMKVVFNTQKVGTATHLVF